MMHSKDFSSVIRSTYLRLRSETGASVDKILADPTLRARFLDLVRQEIGEVDEEHALRSLLNLRKKKQLSRA